MTDQPNTPQGGADRDEELRDELEWAKHSRDWWQWHTWVLLSQLKVVELAWRTEGAESARTWLDNHLCNAEAHDDQAWSKATDANTWWRSLGVIGSMPQPPEGLMARRRARKRAAREPQPQGTDNRELDRLREALTFIAGHADGEKAMDLALDPQLAVRVAQDALAGVEVQPQEASEGQEGGQ